MNLLALHNLILVCIVFSCLLHNHHQIPWPPWCFADWVAIYNVIYIYIFLQLHTTITQIQDDNIGDMIIAHSSRLFHGCFPSVIFYFYNDQWHFFVGESSRTLLMSVCQELSVQASGLDI